MERLQGIFSRNYFMFLEIEFGEGTKIYILIKINLFYSIIIQGGENIDILPRSGGRPCLIKVIHFSVVGKNKFHFY